MATKATSINTLSGIKRRRLIVFGIIYLFKDLCRHELKKQMIVHQPLFFLLYV